MKMKQKRILISGYYGYFNTGDEAVLAVLLSSLRESGNNNVTVLSATPTATRQMHGVDSCSRFGIISLIKSIRNCDVLISGGGGLLQDATSSRSLYYYLLLMGMALLGGKKVMLYANGIGPVNRKINRRLVAYIVKKASVITVRDAFSRQELVDIGVPENKVVQAADPALLLGSIVPVGTSTSANGRVAVALRHWPAFRSSENILVALCDRMVELSGQPVVFVPMQYPHDIEFSRIIISKMRHNAEIIEDMQKPADIYGFLRNTEFVVAMRLHALIFAATAGVPVLGIAYDPKVESFLNQISQPCLSSLTVSGIENALAALETAWNNRLIARSSMLSGIENMKLMSLENNRYLKQFLGVAE